MKSWKFENGAAAISSVISMFLPLKQEGGYESKHHWWKDRLLSLLNNHRNINRQSSPVGLLQGRKITAK